MLFLIIFNLDACFSRAIQNNRQWFASPHNRFSTTMKPLCHTDFKILMNVLNYGSQFGPPTSLSW